MLAKFGLRVPKSERVLSAKLAQGAAMDIGFPAVLKGEDVAHKTEAGAVVLNLCDGAAVLAAANAMPCDTFLVEEMVTGQLVEVLVGVVLDPAHGYVLTIAAGGQLTEILDDKVSLLVPASESAVVTALESLKIWPLLNGYRGADAVDLKSLLHAIDAIQKFTIAHQGAISEVEVNPLICTKNDAIAADALIKIGELQ